MNYRNHPEKLEQKEGITEERHEYLLAQGKEVQFPLSPAGVPLCMERSQSHNVWGPGLNGNVGIPCSTIIKNFAMVKAKLPKSRALLSPGPCRTKESAHP